jgi:hypothetical protein
MQEWFNLTRDNQSPPVVKLFSGLVDEKHERQVEARVNSP